MLKFHCFFSLNCRTIIHMIPVNLLVLSSEYNGVLQVLRTFPSLFQIQLCHILFFGNRPCLMYFYGVGCQWFFQVMLFLHGFWLKGGFDIPVTLRMLRVKSDKSDWFWLCLHSHSKPECRWAWPGVPIFPAHDKRDPWGRGCPVLGLVLDLLLIPFL